MDKLSMAMGITLQNKAALYVTTLAKWLGSPNPQPGPFE